MLWGQGKHLEQGSAPLLLNPAVLPAGERDWGGVETRGLQRSMRLPCLTTPWGPGPQIAGLSHSPSPKSAQESFLLFPEGMDLKGKPLE